MRAKFKKKVEAAGYWMHPETRYMYLQTDVIRA